MANRRDVIIVDFRPVAPYAGVRPALVVQNDRYNARMSNTIVAQITTNIRRVDEDTQLLIDLNHPDWAVSGLHRPSAVGRQLLEPLYDRTTRYRPYRWGVVHHDDAADR